MINWQPLTTEAQLSDIAKGTNPAVIFKHSTTCSISGAALSRFERKYDKSQAGNADFYFLDLLKYRPVSNAIASTFGVTHQSPQALVINHGKCTYNASHMDISFADIADALKATV